MGEQRLFGSKAKCVIVLEIDENDKSVKKYEDALNDRIGLTRVMDSFKWPERISK